MVKAKSNSELNKIALFDSNGKRAESIELNKETFSGRFNKDLLYKSIVMYRANIRRGTASTKTRDEVSGSGKKPWKQKGTGRARVGSKRTPVWRGGGVVFGPHPRSFNYSMPKKMKRGAFVASLNAKLKDGQVLAIEELSLTEPKTKKVSALLNEMKLSERVLLLVNKIDRNLLLSCRNIGSLTLKLVDEATALDVMSSTHVLLTRKATESLNKSVKK
ncbi:MAG: 50S ribosomal protein L4 [Candidatus Omnitrophota bacterium]